MRYTGPSGASILDAVFERVLPRGRDNGRLDFLGGPSVEAIDLLTKEACEFLELLFFRGQVFEFSFMWVCFLGHHSFMTNSSQFQAQYQELRWKYGT